MKDKMKCLVFIGTASSNDSEGIYTFEMDMETGRLKPVEGPVKIYNPSYLALDNKNRCLYSVTQTADSNGRKRGAVAAFSIDHRTGKLKSINQKPASGISMCHLCLDRTGRCLFTANYYEGAIMAFPVLADGSIADESGIIRHKGSGPDPERQEKAHVHHVSVTPDNRYLCAVDLGTDQIKVYGFDPSVNHLSPAESFSLDIRPGFGPRHMEFHPDGRHAYLINELISGITVLEYDPTQAVFKAKQYVSTLPDDFSGVSYGAAVHISPDGSYLFASNRGHDSVAVFSIDQVSGSVAPVSYTSTEGSWPRDFDIDPTGRFLLAANQDSDSIVPFKMDYLTGKLERSGDAVRIPSPVCIKFAMV